MKLEMSDAFMDWLGECPCAWSLINHEKEGVATYTFVEEEE